MLPSEKHSIHLFRAAGIDVYLHWLWFPGAVIRYLYPIGDYSAHGWIVLEVLAVFLIVLLHEFGHSLACRSVGGRAEEIILWPFGGVAFVSPPPRPGAVLWSIAAGPLVNIALTPILGVPYYLARLGSLSGVSPNAANFIQNIFFVNLVILGFNLLPVFPLDGGQILQSLLWFFLGRARSLQAATIVGFIGAAVFTALALYLQSPIFLILTAFLFSNCVSSWRYAKHLLKDHPDSTS
jgi:Zn-dependent protease